MRTKSYGAVIAIGYLVSLASLAWPSELTATKQIRFENERAFRAANGKLPTSRSVCDRSTGIKSEMSFEARNVFKTALALAEATHAEYQRYYVPGLQTQLTTLNSSNSRSFITGAKAAEGELDSCAETG
jgi:hypothetical protein